MKFDAPRTVVAGVVLFALLFLAFHLPYLPSSLEDLDSINFALGLHHFDVARHQPHPPGYPLFILAGRLARGLAASDARALALVSVVAGALGLIAIAAFVRRLTGESGGWCVAATALAVTSPLYWFTADRPLSDMSGTAAAVAIQALTLGARGSSGLATAAFLAGLAIGLRSQVFWLTIPLLAWKLPLWGRTAVRPQSGDRPQSGVGPRYKWAVGGAFAAGLLIWFVPLVMLTGGLGAYWRAVTAQGGEDLSGIRMLSTTPTPRELLDSFYYAFVAPWAAWPIALSVLVAATAGAAALWRRKRPTLILLAIAFGPYLLFDILFQETFTSRYALPLVIPIAILATAGLRLLPATAAAVLATALIMFNAHVGGRSIAAYAREAAPAFRLLADMRTTQTSTPPVLAADRRQSLDLRRPLIWLDTANADGPAPRFDRQLAAPPQHEWLEAVRYWNAGGRAPVWFVVDPRRAAIGFVQHDDPATFRWALPWPILMSGTRPNDADWYRVERPDWYVGEGWALTPEAAGVADADRRGPAFGPIDAWVRREALDGGALLLGGRNFDPATTMVRFSAEDAAATSVRAASGFFMEVLHLPPAAATSQPDYVHVSIAVDPPARVAVEQFDVAHSRAVLGFGSGWQEPELDPSSGRQWRWLSDRGELRYMTPAGHAASSSPGAGWVLRIAGEAPRRYYARDSHMVVRAGTTVLASATIGDDFTLDVPVPAATEPATLVVETDQTHVPAESRWRRSADRRRLGLRIFSCRLRPASSPDTGASSRPAR